MELRSLKAAWELLGTGRDIKEMKEYNTIGFLKVLFGLLAS